MGKINLRPATPADAKMLAHLWIVTFPDKFGPILGEKAELILGDWLRLSQRHLQTTTIAEVGQRMAGFIVLETPTAPRPDDGRWLWQALQRHNGLCGALWRLLLMLIINNNRRSSDDEIYIEMLGVDPDWRGRGVARQLLAYTEAVAYEQQIDRLALTVVSDNVLAIRLYEKWGFKAQSEQPRRLLKWITGHPGYYEMIKQLQRDQI